MTLNQKPRIKINKNRKQKNKIKNCGIIRNKPQIKGLVVKLYTMTPKKPNSALRKVAKVKINISPNYKSNTPININKSSFIIAYISGEKHTLSLHNLVLLQPGKKKDLPGVKYRIIRGALDCK